MGSLVFSGEGGSSAASAIDTTAAGDLWDNGSGFGSPKASEAGDNSMLHTLPSFMDDLTIKAGYSPGSAGGSSATSYSALTQVLKVYQLATVLVKLKQSLQKQNKQL